MGRLLPLFLRLFRVMPVPKSWIRGFEAAKVASLHSNAPRSGLKMGAAIFQKGALVAVGFNSYNKSHPSVQGKAFDWNTHAEQAALIKRQHYSSHGDVLYVYRETFDGKLGCSKPCVRCEHFIRLAGIKKVRYIDTDGSFKELKL